MSQGLGMLNQFISNRGRGQRYKRTVIALILASLLLYVFVGSQPRYAEEHVVVLNEPAIASKPTLPTPEQIDVDAGKLHILLPVQESNINLCKLLVGLKVLGYPVPTLVTWGDQHDEDAERMGLKGAGTHLTKVFSALEYLESLSSTADNDLVLLMDALDIWVQLPPAILVSRYHAIIRDTFKTFQNLPSGQHTAQTHNISNKIVFGAGKRCNPNYYHTVACYPLPVSPLPEDLYGANTDTIIGRNVFYSFRQQFLNSGYVIGPVKDMRRMFAKAQQIIDTAPIEDPEENGAGESHHLYSGSDQSVFSTLLGKQEWAREALRVGWKKNQIYDNHKQSSWSDRGSNDIKPRQGRLHDLVVDNVLEPSFTHEKMDYDAFEKDPHQFEFGITLDYWSDLGHQTVNSEMDARFLTYDEYGKVKGQISDQVTGRNKFDCEIRMANFLPEDILAADMPLPLSFYTHLCLGRVPVFVHHNGWKNVRDTDWHRVWYAKGGKQHLLAVENTLQEAAHGINAETFEAFKMSPKPKADVSAWSKTGLKLTWQNVCQDHMGEGSALFPRGS